MSKFRAYFAALPLAALVSFSLLAGQGTSACADATGDTIRTLFTKYQGAAVTLTVVIRAAGGGNGESQDLELSAPAFVIDPSGLLVTSDATVDPAGMMSRGGDPSQKVTTKVLSAKIVTISGDTIPVQVVLRDSDRNLAFLRPVTPATTPMPYIDLHTAGDAHIGDAVYFLEPLGRAGNRMPSLVQYRIMSVLDRPRTLYVPDGQARGGTGSAAFNEQGAPLGLVTVRIGVGRAPTSMSTISTDTAIQVIVPAADILDEVKQAMAAKMPPPVAVTPLVKTTAPAPTTPQKPAARP